MRKLDKRGATNKTGIWIGVGVLVTLVLVSFMFIGQNVGQVPVDPDKPSVCDSTTSPTLNIKAVDKETGTALTEGTNLYRIQGERTWNTFTAGTGFAVDAGLTLDVVMGIDTTDFTNNAYGQMVTVKVPCSESPSVEYEMANDELYSSLTSTFYNNDANAAGESFSTGQTQDVSIKLQAGVDEFFGNPYFSGNPNVICLALNTTAWDVPVKVSVKGGSDLARVSTPIRQAGSSTATNYCYELPVITEDQIEVILKLNADDTTAPAIDDTATMYAGNYYYNSDTQEIEFGVENQEGSAVGTDSGDDVTLDFTP